MTLAAEQRFTTNDDEFSSELIDREIIVINFDTGNYYSLRGMAARIWQWMRCPAGLAEITAAIRKCCSEVERGFERDIEAFLMELLDEGLIVGVSGKQGPVEPLDTSRHDQDTGAYAAPVLEKYTDMQELIVLDAIQE